MALRDSELAALRRNGPLWRGLTKRGYLDPDIEESRRHGLVALNPNGEGYVITGQGIEYLERISSSKLCPHCGQRMTRRNPPHD